MIASETGMKNNTTMAVLSVLMSYCGGPLAFCANLTSSARKEMPPIETCANVAKTLSVLATYGRSVLSVPTDTIVTSNWNTICSALPVATNVVMLDCVSFLRSSNTSNQ